MDTIKDKNKVQQTIMVGGGLLLGLMALSGGIKFISNAGQSVKVSEQEIQVIAPVKETQPLMIGQSTHNQNVQKSQSELELASDYLADMINQSQEALITARAKRWLLHASDEAPKEKLTEGEYLNQQLLVFVEDIRKLSNNGALDPTPEDMDRYISSVVEIQAIATAMTKYPEGGASNRVDVTRVLMGGNDFYMKALALSNVQRFGAESMLKVPNRQNPAHTESAPEASEESSPKAFEETEEEVTEDGN